MKLDLGEKVNRQRQPDGPGHSLRPSLRASLRVGLRNSLRGDLWDNLQENLWGNLWFFLWVNLRDSPEERHGGARVADLRRKSAT